MHIRAVHFELCNDQISESITNALTRFCCTRGDPDIIYSDNQSSFIKVSKHLHTTIPRPHMGSIIASVGERRRANIQWKTNSPEAPHQGGRWERMVRSMKRALLALENSSPVFEDDFRTILIEAADLLNSRPLTGGPDFIDPLTPNHFLIGKAKSDFSEEVELEKHYEKIKIFMEQLWNRFTAEILIDNRDARKWNKEKENPKVDDIGIIVDIGAIKGTWRLGRIVEVIPGKDCKIRNVIIKTNEKKLQRSMESVILLPQWSSKN